jgi:hypothetical protein
MIKEPKKGRNTALSGPNLATQPLSRPSFFFFGLEPWCVASSCLRLRWLDSDSRPEPCGSTVVFSYLTAHACSHSCLNHHQAAISTLRTPGTIPQLCLVERCKRGFSSAAEPLVSERPACAVHVVLRACELSHMILTTPSQTIVSADRRWHQTIGVPRNLFPPAGKKQVFEESARKAYFPQY